MSQPSRILIVDDSPEDCAAYQRYLERGGKHDFTFLIAHSAAAGLERCRTETPDCILLDFNLPDSDGLDFLTKLRQEHGDNGPPVVMVTGQGNEAVAVKAMKLGAQDYLVKGFSADGLRQPIKKAIENAALRRQVDAHQREVARLSEVQAKLVQELKMRAVELADADRRKNEFLAVLAHELRNPLGPIRNAAQIIRLARNSATADRETASNIIDRQVDQMSHLINDLLDVSRIVQGKVQLHKECLDLVNLVRSTLEDHWGEFDKAELNLVLNIPGIEVWVDGDPIRLSQILGNILDNARKFTPKGGTITVSLRAAPTGNTACIQVADSGEGVEPEMLDRMFEVFSQADRSLDRSRGGLGLGLAIVRGLVELHGGKVSAASEGPGRGCEISLTLPLTTPPKKKSTPKKLAPGTVSPLRIFIIEDNRDAAECLRLLLQTLGHKVAMAFTGQGSLQSARSFRPELVLCDIGLADGMTGFDVAKQFRQDPVLADTYLVALSGYGREEDRKRASDSGFNLHLTKPMSLEALQNLLSSIAKA